MATRFDVAGRLAEGLAAVDDLQTYVTASRARGYTNPDLTLYNSQLRDCYGAEDGLDLRLLDADCAQLRTAAQAADEALRIARAQAAALAGAWRGSGGAAVTDFLDRHCAAGTTVSDAVRSAADACTRLCDELWRAVDHKVATAVSIDDRTLSPRPVWLAAARVVTAGAVAADDPSAAVVDAQIKPFVDNDIRGEWLPAMRAATGAVAAAYQVAVDAMGSRVAVRFEIPGDLGPQYAPPPSATPGVAADVPAATVRPAAALPLDDAWVDEPLPMTAPLPATPSPMAAAPQAPPVVPQDPPMLPAAAPGFGSIPATGGAPELGGGGVGDVAGRIGDLLGSLIGGTGDGVPDPPDLPADHALDDPVDDTADDGGDEPTIDDQPAADTDSADEGDTDDTEDAEEPAASAPEGGECPEDVAEPESKPEPEPVAADPAPAASAAPVSAPGPAASAGATPCEIAADELPQAGQ